MSRTWKELEEEEVRSFLVVFMRAYPLASADTATICSPPSYVSLSFFSLCSRYIFSWTQSKLHAERTTFFPYSSIIAGYSQAPMK